MALTMIPPKSPTPGTGAGELFQLLRNGRPRTRSELASETGLSRSTIAARIDALLDSGLIGAVGPALSSGGRPPSTFAFAPDSRTVLAADLGAAHGILALTDLAGNVVDHLRADLDITSGPVPVLDWVVRSFGELLRRNGRDASTLSGIAIGVPGPVEHSTGRPTKPPIMPGWNDFDIPGTIRRTFDVPVLVDNDVNIMALGEQSFNWPDTENLMFVKVATGIGVGIISGGELQRGAQGSAGDLGHVQVPGGANTPCRCGNSGCLEALAGGPAVARNLADFGIEVATASEVGKLAEANNTAAIQVLRQAGRDIGSVLAMCVNLLNPSVIVLGGRLANAGEHVIAGVRELVYFRSTPLATQHLVIVGSAAREMAGVRGASMLVIQHVLSAAAVDELVQQRADAQPAAVSR
ncbi:ROK family transcriptional regulator [Paeniglutamicibacter sp. ABSL32-1]|uniref:ROK family transcriptional regulator n=1 Tax=Paeniglutamicibacter quisquiliarum TaxID=2849498 RepID=UPI001C2D23D2|nr:ROK family transcriptional regulator [Paeniglutamicibacter quisquiliarum]MBV1779684.1 ROK family transcriptional regulator [Paeniglutamicibacter quisquiliarum]